MITANQRLLGILSIAAFILLVPFIAMQFTNEVNWSLFDFTVAGVLLFGTGLMCELAIRIIKGTRYRLLVILGILAVLFLVWAELAVGIFGTPLAGS